MTMKGAHPLLLYFFVFYREKKGLKLKDDKICDLEKQVTHDFQICFHHIDACMCM
jgi:hypothetical protein